MVKKFLVIPILGLGGFLLYKFFHTDHQVGSYSNKDFNNELIVWLSEGIKDVDLNDIFEEKVFPFDVDTVIKNNPHIKIVNYEYREGAKAIGRVLMWKDLAKYYGDIYGVPYGLILAIIGVESKGNPNAYRYERAINDASFGLMQLLCRTAKSIGYKGICRELLDPATSIKYGVKYLAYLKDKYGDWIDVIAAYNAGRPVRYGKHYYRNQLYVNKVITWLKLLQDYWRKYGY